MFAETWTQRVAQLLLGLVILAVPATAPCEVTQAIAEASERFNRGIELYSGGMYEAALAEFERAYELSPRFTVLYNIGQVQVQLGRFPEALGTFERFIAIGGDAISPQRRAEVEQELERLDRLVARVTITVPQLDGAQIYLDGMERGISPLDEPLIMSSGTHVVEVRAVGYLPFRRTISVAGASTLDITVELMLPPEVEAAPGTIVVMTPTRGATVTVDGEVIGTTPLLQGASLPPGSYNVELTRPGYVPEQRIVSVTSGNVSEVEMELRPRVDIPPEHGGWVDVSASEQDVEIRLDGQPMPPGPVPIGPHLVEASRDGFRPWAQQIELAAGQRLELEANLRPTDGYYVTYMSRARKFRAAAWTMVGLALASAGLAVGLYAWNVGRDRDWHAEQDHIRGQLSLDYTQRDPRLTNEELTVRHQTVSDNIDSLTAWSALEGTLVGVGAVATVVAVVLFVVGPSPRRYRNLALRPRPGGMTLAFQWD